MNKKISIIALGMLCAFSAFAQVKANKATTNAIPWQGNGAASTEWGSGAAAANAGTAYGVNAGASGSGTAVGGAASALGAGVSIGFASSATFGLTANATNVAIGDGAQVQNGLTNAAEIMRGTANTENSISFWGIPAITKTNSSLSFVGNGSQLSGIYYGQISGAGNAILADTNAFASINSITTHDSSQMVVTTNYLSPLGTIDWVSLGYNALGSYHGSEFYLNELGQQNIGPLCLLCVPEGTTNVTFSGWIRTLSGTASPTVRIQGGSTTITNVTLSNVGSSTWVNWSLTINSAQIANFSTNLNAGFFMAGGSFSLSNMVVTMSGTTDPIASSPFKRYAVKAQNLEGEGGSIRNDDFDKSFSPSWENLNQSRAGSHSVLKFDTAANSIGIETANYANGALGSSWPLEVAINSDENPAGFTVITNVYPPASPIYKYFNIRLGTNNLNKTKTVRITSSFDFCNFAGNFVRGIYVPKTNYVSFAKTKGQRKILLIGASIMADNNPADGINDTRGLIESYLPATVIGYAFGSASLKFMWNSDLQKQKLCGLISIEKPDDIIIGGDLGINELGNNGYGDGTNGFSQDLGLMIDTIHAIAPAARIFNETILFNTAYGMSGAGAGGYTIMQYRDAQNAVGLARSNYCRVLNASNWLNSADIQGDGIHPTSSGIVKHASILVQNLWTNTFAPSGLPLNISLPVANLTAYTSTNTLVVGTLGVTNTTQDTYLVSPSAGLGMVLKDANGNGIIAPVLNTSFPLKPGWRLTGTSITAYAIIQSK